MTVSESQRPLRVAVFGVGSLGEHHARLYAALPEAELIGVYDANAARAREIAAKYGTRAFERPEELAAEIEAASVAAPTDLHQAVAGPLLDRGIHLLVEKPIAATLAEAEDLVARAEARRVAPYPPPRGGGLRPRGTEVSVVHDLMIHDLDLVLHLAGAAPAEVRASGLSLASDSPDYAAAWIAFENGVEASLVASRIHPDRARGLRLFYDDAVVELDFMLPAAVEARKGGDGIERAALPIVKEEPLRAELGSFLRCVRERCPPVVDGRRATEALRLSLEVLRRIADSPA